MSASSPLCQPWLMNKNAKGYGRMREDKLIQWNKILWMPSQMMEMPSCIMPKKVEVRLYNLPLMKCRSFNRSQAFQDFFRCWKIKTSKAQFRLHDISRVGFWEQKWSKGTTIDFDPPQQIPQCVWWPIGSQNCRIANIPKQREMIM